jgi:flagellar protein FliO/FliZ
VSGYTGYLVETFVTLLAVCAIAFVVLYGARRVGLGRPQGPIDLVGQLPLDARRTIYLVKVGAHVLVVGVAEGGMTKLGELSAAELPASAITGADGAGFTRILARVLSSRRPPRDAGAGHDSVAAAGPPPRAPSDEERPE